MTCENLLPFLVKHPIKNTHPFKLIFKLYQQQFLNVSVEKGLIDSKHLSIAGDGTPVRTSSLLRKKRICSCKQNGITKCKCKRLFSQPDCNSGWDSSRECYFNGYHLYMFVASDSYSDLPVFPLLERASRHDMLSFLHTFFSRKIPFSNWCLRRKAWHHKHHFPGSGTGSAKRPFPSSKP